MSIDRRSRLIDIVLFLDPSRYVTSTSFFVRGLGILRTESLVKICKAVSI